MEEKILKLKRQVSELLEWKNSFDLQQVVNPLGDLSRIIVQKDLLISKRIFGTAITVDCYLEIIDPDGLTWWIGADEQ